MPSVPTLDESGLTGFDYSGWYGVIAPAGVPKEIIARLNGVIVKAISAPEMKAWFANQGREPAASTPDQFAALIKSELAQNAKLVKAAGLKAE